MPVSCVVVAIASICWFWVVWMDVGVFAGGAAELGLRRVRRCGVLMLLFLPLVVLGQEPNQSVYSVRVPWDREYYKTLLQMVLEESKQPGEVIRLEQMQPEYSQARWIYETQFQPEDQPPLVLWTATSRDRERVLRPIRIPLLKGLMGKRVFLIREGEQARFDRVQTLEDLARLRAGQGSHWPDTDILRANGLAVTTTSNSDLLFRMLRGRRFDYLPRGVTEAWHELETRDTEGLSVERRLVLSYPFALYFFVNKEHQDLAQRIESGLKGLIVDGRFDHYFFNHPRNKNALREIQSQPRRVFYLENSQLPSETPLQESHLWYQLPFEPKSEALE